MSSSSAATADAPRSIGRELPVVGSVASLASRLERIGSGWIRYGTAIVIAWIGAMKFTAYEAGAIEGLLANSPFLAWGYNLLSVEGFAIAIALTELGVALLIALKPVSAKAAALGGLLAIGMFGTTLSFMLTTPGVFEQSLGGFPALSVVPGQFLVKDLILLGVAIWLFGDALRDVARKSG